MKKTWPGFTLIEAITSIVLAALISLVVAAALAEGISAWTFFSGQKSLAVESRAALYRLTREIKLINGQTNILTFESDRLDFIDENSQTVSFAQVGSRLQRNSETLLANLATAGGFRLTYLDSTETVTMIKSRLRVINVRLTTLRNENKYVLESAARLRVQDL